MARQKEAADSNLQGAKRRASDRTVKDRSWLGKSAISGRTSAAKGKPTASRFQEKILSLGGTLRLSSPSGRALRDYITALRSKDVETQRETKDKLPERLRRSHEAPQIVTVKPRGDNPGGEYVIVPSERFVDLVEAAAPERRGSAFVPITALMREVAEVEIGGAVRPRATGRRLRSSRARLPSSS